MSSRREGRCARDVASKREARPRPRRRRPLGLNVRLGQIALVVAAVSTGSSGCEHWGRSHGGFTVTGPRGRSSGLSRTPPAPRADQSGLTPPRRSTSSTVTPDAYAIVGVLPRAAPAGRARTAPQSRHCGARVLVDGPLDDLRLPETGHRRRVADLLLRGFVNLDGGLCACHYLGTRVRAQRRGVISSRLMLAAQSMQDPRHDVIPTSSESRRVCKQRIAAISPEVARLPDFEAVGVAAEHEGRPDYRVRG